MKLHLQTQGDISNAAILFIHGNSLNSRSFSSQFNIIREIPLIAIDLPGHGLSPKASNIDEEYCLPGYVNVIKQVVKDFGLKNCILAGHSLGGHIAIESLEELPSVSGLMIFGTPPLGSPPDMGNAFLPEPVMNLLFQKDLTESDIDAICRVFLTGNKTASFEKNIKEQLLSSDGNTRISLLKSIGEGKQKDELGIIKNTKLPTAVIHGENDALVNYNYLANVSYGNLWQNKIHIVPGSGHFPQMEQAEAFAKLLMDFHKHCSNE